MKFFLASVFVLGGAIQGVTPFQQRGLTAAPRRPYYSKALHVAQDVQETIEAGQEPAGTVVGCNIPDCKVLRVGGVDDLDDEVELEAGETVSEFWCRMTVPGDATQTYMSKLMKEAKKNANFPGFRPGQIPPYAKPQMVAFAMEEAINTGLLDVIDSAGLTALSGDDANAQILEDIKAMSKTFKPGSELTFTATFRAKETGADDEDDTTASENASLSEEPAAVDAEIVEPVRNPWYDAEGDRGSWYDAGIRL
jgi:hypothetical protein